MFSEQVIKAATYIATLAIIYSSGVIFYNLCLHPLSKYPGSWLYTSTPFPRLWLYISGHEPFVVLEMHKRYGNIFRIAPNELCFIDEQAWKEIYGHKNNNPKDPTLYPFSPDTKKSLILANDEDHHRLRKMFLPAFSAKALRDQSDMLNGHVRKLVEVLKSKKGEQVDLVKYYNFTTFDVIADLCFGESLGLLEGQKYTPWLQGIFDQIFLACSSRAIQYFPLLWTIAQKLIPKSIDEAATASFKHSADRLDKRTAMDTDRPDIFGLVLQHKDGASMSRQTMYANADLLMIAGTETTATMLSGLTYNLLRNPDPLKRLTAEIRNRFATVEDITINDLPRLPYLTACIQEGLRTYPSVAEGVRRMTNPTTGAEICGHWIPPNVGLDSSTNVNISRIDRLTFVFTVYLTMRPTTPPTTLPTPTASSLSVSSQKTLKVMIHVSPRIRKHKSLSPLALEPFVLIQMNYSLAYHEMRLITAHLLWNFDLEADGLPNDWLDQTVHVVWDKIPLEVKMLPKDRVRFEVTA
ncbi:cytochrome P450 [Aureobasidium subglaciale]|nr:cytochrome P450 [Aureobasidium subglaciale]